MSRQWPSGWEDPEDEELDAEELDEETEVRLSEVAAFLATVPAPVLPGAIESRIVAALAAESAARDADSPARAAEPAGPRILRAAPATSRAQARAQARARARMHRRRRFSSAMVAGPLVAILLFAGLGYAISRGSSSSSSSAPAIAEPASSAAAGSSASASGPIRSGAGSGAAGDEKTPYFALSGSGTKYLAATLVSQVRAELAEQHSTPAAAPTAPTAPSASATSAPAAASASSTSVPGTSSVTGAAKDGLISRGCVLHFTKTPRLIDRGTYQGTPAYVIATNSHVWVVGLGCTAQHPDLIASASLAG